MDREEKALHNFDAELNCAQAVLGAYTDRIAITSETAYAIACGFGAGMGRLQETCGAVTGAFMVLGIDTYHKFGSHPERKDSVYSKVQQFSEQFKNIHGTLDCRDLLKVDLNTEQGNTQMKEQNLRELVCKRCIVDAVKIADTLIES